MSSSNRAKRGALPATYRCQTSYARFDHMISEAAPNHPAAPFAGPRMIRRDDAPTTSGATTRAASSPIGSSRRPISCTCWSSSCRPVAGFRHTANNPTLFAADVAYLWWPGRWCLTDPETGENGGSPRGRGLFGRDTWHHGYAWGRRPPRWWSSCRPPPSRGRASTYGRTRPLLRDPAQRTSGGHGAGRRRGPSSGRLGGSCRCGEGRPAVLPGGARRSTWCGRCWTPRTSRDTRGRSSPARSTRSRGRRPRRWSG